MSSTRCKSPQRTDASGTKEKRDLRHYAATAVRKAKPRASENQSSAKRGTKTLCFGASVCRHLPPEGGSHERVELLHVAGWSAARCIQDKRLSFGQAWRERDRIRESRTTDIATRLPSRLREYALGSKSRFGHNVGIAESKTASLNALPKRIVWWRYSKPASMRA